MSKRNDRPEWILASASPRRKEILSRLGMNFLVDPSHIPEPDRRPGEKIPGYVVRIARLKARETAKRHDTGRIISADTIVVSGNRLMGKPSSREDAKNMLARLSGQWHEVWTGLCLLDCEKDRSRADYARSRVHFRRLTATEMEWYLDTEEYRDKAGAYAIQGYASLFIDRIEGCYFNIVGFPVAVFERLCHKSGVDLKTHLDV